jgi:hypothetical protein
MASAQFRTLPARQPTPLSSKLPLTKEELQKEIMTKLKGWTLAYQVNVLQRDSGSGCLLIKKAAGITQVTKHDNQNCRLVMA